MNITAAGRTLGTALLPLSEGEDKDSHILMTFTALTILLDIRQRGISNFQSSGSQADIELVNLCLKCQELCKAKI